MIVEEERRENEGLKERFGKLLAGRNELREKFMDQEEQIIALNENILAQNAEVEPQP